MYTLEELKEKLIEQVSELDLIDALGLTSENIVYAFEDKIEERFDKLIELVE